MNPFFESILSGKNFFDVLTQTHQTSLIEDGEKYVKGIYQNNATQDAFLAFIQKVDELLYQEDKLGFVKAQYLSNIYFHRLKTEKFNFNNPPPNPLNIKLDHKTLSLCNTKFFISKKTIDEIMDYAKNYYLAIHNETLAIEKVNMLNNLATIKWAQDIDSPHLIQKSYKKEKEKIEKIKLLMEVDKLEGTIAKAKPSEKLKI